MISFDNKSNNVIKQAKSLRIAGQIQSLVIPEPTKSLLFVTDEDTQKIRNASSIHISFAFGGEDTEGNSGLNCEPSMIWTRLPVQKNSELELEPMYYPSYSGLSPKHRYQYLTWLQDITKETNLSYVFLYYYGLERHLLLGDFNLASQEILRLLKYHNKGTFTSYSKSALITSAIFRKRFDIFVNNKELLSGVSNETLAIRKVMNDRLVARDVIELSSEIGFKNKRYIKLHPKTFESELENFIIKYEYENGGLLDLILEDNITFSNSLIFANRSIPENIRNIRIPNIIGNIEFKNVCLKLLTETHEKIKNSR